jgi:single-strand DNA-binding protein
MGKDLNNLSIVGRAVKDAAIAYTSSGTCYAKFSIAVNGYKENSVSFFDCIMWGKTAENVGKYITKGKQCAYKGEIEQNKYTDKEGNNRYSFQIKVSDVQLLGGGQQQSARDTEQLFQSKDTNSFNEDVAF